MTMHCVIVGEEAYNGLSEHDREYYAEVGQTPDGDRRWELRIDFGENWSNLAKHSEWGSLARALHRKQAEGTQLKQKLADLKAKHQAPDSDTDIAALKRRNAAELFALENQSAGELAQLRAERQRMEKVLSDYDRKAALRAAITKAGIAPRFTDAVVALVLNDVMIVGERPMARTDFGMMGLDDYVLRWSQSDEGEPYRLLDARRSNRRAPPGTFAARVAGMK